MPRIAKEKKELEKESKKTTKKSVKKSSTTNTKKTTTTTKKTSAKSKTAKSSNKKETKKTTSKTSTKKKKEFLSEYYDLPYRYNETTVKVLAQTPNILFVYWDISDVQKQIFKSQYGDDFLKNTIPILKVFNKTKNYNFEVEINDFANCWYINVADSNCDYQIELARKEKYDNYISPKSNYVHITFSNDIITPNNHVLFELLTDTITLKNVKTNTYRNVKIPKNSKKLYNSNLMSNLFYKDIEVNSTSNPSSDFKNI